ncbi:MAG: hypothetical protein CK426_08740 [Legionella sp.]|nr:MAG: hypothetical protein CK423_07255 [Legionella sp.]PJD97148.1 MAG: hypothetical protein CK426_08740 [Legionella sp.]
MKTPFIAVGSLLVILNANTMANPVPHQVTFTCPTTRVIANFGDYIAGYGVSTILGENRPVYFKSLTKNATVPNNLTSYAIAGTLYDSTTSQVICNYNSSIANNKPFSLVYTMTNGSGGVITAQTDSIISIQLPIGIQ